MCVCHVVNLRALSHLDQPTKGGTAQAKAMNQVKAQPIAEWVAVNLKLPIGLHTTMYLSMAKTTRDHRDTWPKEKQKSRAWIKILKNGVFEEKCCQQENKTLI